MRMHVPPIASPDTIDPPPPLRQGLWTQLIGEAWLYISRSEHAAQQVSTEQGNLHLVWLSGSVVCV